MVKLTVMKRYKSILFVMFSILGCQSEIEQDANTNVNAIPMSFYAGIEIPKDSILTKTVLDGSPSDAFRDVLWEYQDEVYVTNGTQSSKFINTSVETSEIALLEGELAEGTNYYAAYPYNIVTNSSLSSFTIDLPSEQTYCADGIESEAFPMVAHCEEGVFNFKNICGILVVQLLGEQTVTSISFSGKDSDGNSLPVAGIGKVSMDYSDSPTLVMNNSSENIVTLSCPKGVRLSSTTPTTFHVVLPIGIYNSFELNITADNESATFVKSGKMLNIKRSMRITSSAFNLTNSGSRMNYIDEYGVNHGPGVEIDGVVWAPVNCGFHSTDYKYGKLYQWGRKYGQGYSGEFYDGDWEQKYSDATTPLIIEGKVDEVTGNHKSKSNVFYVGSSNWIDSRNDKLWNSGTQSNPIKAEYDPCPDGWRIPTIAELNNLSKNHSSWTLENNQCGYWFSGETSYTETINRVFLPAAGYRSCAEDRSYKRGDCGFYWSSRPISAFATYLSFSSTDIGSSNTDRASGQSVRCVKE